MHTTTVRFDPETWERLKQTSGRLGIASAEYIRTATIQRLERGEYEPRLARLEERVERIARVVDRWVRRLSESARR
ncbi:ribbon-helix-helix domain-containing protein [Conexibacter stalactiti]|uniref:ribbon-helix-helix domain-containing protein n=1 Tax=Conexibacter stalactiti TaxID=1940611 RepID=UPI00385021EC